MSSISGTNARPFSVSAYSTRGGTSGKVERTTIASSSSARSRSDSVRGLMPSRCFTPESGQKTYQRLFPVGIGPNWRSNVCADDRRAGIFAVG